MADGAGSSSVVPTPAELQDENSVTLQDLLDEEQELEDDANAVLGGSDDKNCTYEQGYVRRQALYACKTCVMPGSLPAGICLACSYACHEGHDLYELYTKRNFRCDCGNSRFPPANPCRLCPEKDGSNMGNSYNHNFQGLYCTCQRPYPDPDDDVADVMLQCVMCEDWYHGRHLGGEVPGNRDYSEVTCPGCMDQHPFLWCYFAGASSLGRGEDDDGTNEKAGNSEMKLENGCSMAVTSTAQETGATRAGDGTMTRCPNGVPNGTGEHGADAVGPSTTTTASQHLTDAGYKEEKSESSSAASSSSTCFLSRLKREHPKRAENGESRCVFWPSGWRSQLCRCPDCQNLYKELSCQFLLDEDDTVQSYEERGKAAQPPAPTGDPLMSALGSLGRVQQIEAIHGYNNLKTELTDFFKQFATSRKVVREEDVREFFVQMQARKRQKVSSVPYFCR